EADRQESRDYVAENPHRQQLENIFELASIEYGRIDYGLVDGAVQTFEINSNPTVLAEPPGWSRTADYRRYATMHAHALQILARPNGGMPIHLGCGTKTAAHVNSAVLASLRR